MDSAKEKWAARVERTGGERSAAARGFGKRERAGIDDAKSRVIAPKKDSKASALTALMMKLSVLVRDGGKKPPAKRKRT